jgi:hypothetical protein
MRNTPAVEAAWKVVKGTKDVSSLRQFSTQFPSRQRRAEAQQRLIEIGAPTFPADVLFRAATDPDVLECYRINDLTAPVCERALEKFPDIGLFLSDFRFRYEFCEILEQLGHCHDVWASLGSKPLFEKSLLKLSGAGPTFKAIKEGIPHIEHHEKTSKSAKSLGPRHRGQHEERMHRSLTAGNRSYGPQAREFARPSSAAEPRSDPSEHHGGHGR